VIWTSAYVASVVFVNWAFAALPMIPLPWGPLSPGSFLVGGIFILRDFAQREAGHRVLLATGLGIVVSFVMADPFVAVASTLAFGASELADWAVYTLTKRPFRDRVFLSSCVSVPLDTAVFLAGIGGLTWIGFVVMCLSKSVALAVVLWPRASLGNELVTR
jgi:uncharacterized PurR-regulated membrane protein YhhQ (DUF165 family)